MSDFVELVRFNASGLVPSIAQDFKSKQVLMLAWMSRESLLKTLETGSAVYFSRSRNRLWHKGETSGQFQIVKEIFLDYSKYIDIAMKGRQHVIQNFNWIKITEEYEKVISKTIEEYNNANF